MEEIKKIVGIKGVGLTKQLAMISQKLDLSFAATPLNQNQERDAFFQALRVNKKRNPKFVYPKLNINAVKLNKEIDAIFSNKKEIIVFKKVGLYYVLERMHKYLKKKIALINAIGENEFSRYSIALYSKPSESCCQLSRRILEQGNVNCDETVKACEIKNALEQEIEKFNLNWKVKLVDNITTKVSISSFKKEVLVNNKLNFTPFEVQRLKIHEVDVHVLRAENGSTQPLAIFQTGLEGYQETEEGLSVYFEEKTGVLDNLQERLYAARAFAVELTFRGSFFYVFSELSKYLSSGLAYRITERVKRGLGDTSRRGGLSKDYYYINGRERIREYINNGGDAEILFIGKIGLEDIYCMQKLLDQGLLSKPKVLPDFITSGKLTK